MTAPTPRVIRLLDGERHPIVPEPVEEPEVPATEPEPVKRKLVYYIHAPTGERMHWTMAGTARLAIMDAMDGNYELWPYAVANGYRLKWERVADWGDDDRAFARAVAADQGNAETGAECGRVGGRGLRRERELDPMFAVAR